MLTNPECQFRQQLFQAAFPDPLTWVRAPPLDSHCTPCFSSPSTYHKALWTMAHTLVDLLHHTVSSPWMGPCVKHLWIPKVCRCLVNICQINGWIDGWWTLGKWCLAGNKNTRYMGNMDMKLRSRDRDEQPRLDWMSWSQWGHGFSVWGSRGVPRVRLRKVRGRSGVTWSLRGSGYMLVVLV